MAYSSNPITVERMMPHLKPLLDGGEVRYRAPGKARWLAYRLREALSVARDFPQQFPALAEAAGHYRIEVPNADEVRAVLRPQVTVETEELVPRAWSAVPYARAEVINETLASPEQLVMEWMREGHDGEKLYFPNANLGNDDLLTLYGWAQEEGVLIFENAGAITLLPLVGNEDTAVFAWTPDDIKEED